MSGQKPKPTNPAINTILQFFTIVTNRKQKQDFGTVDEKMDTFFCNSDKSHL